MAAGHRPPARPRGHGGRAGRIGIVAARAAKGYKPLTAGRAHGAKLLVSSAGQGEGSEVSVQPLHFAARSSQQC